MLLITLRIVVHVMATILLAAGLFGLFFTTGYDVGAISAEDQSHLRVFWAVPIIASLLIHYGLYVVYIAKDIHKSKKGLLILRGVALWMMVAAIVRIFSIVVLGDPMPRLAPILVEVALVPLLWYLSTKNN